MLCSVRRQILLEGGRTTSLVALRPNKSAMGSADAPVTALARRAGNMHQSAMRQALCVSNPAFAIVGDVEQFRRELFHRAVQLGLFPALIHGPDSQGCEDVQVVHLREFEAGALMISGHLPGELQAR